MLCRTCEKRFNCIPAALAANDRHMFALLEQLKQCDRYAKEEQGVSIISQPQRQSYTAAQNVA